MFISIGKAIETCAPRREPPSSPLGLPGHVDEQVVGPDPDFAVAAHVLSELVQDRGDAEW